MDHFRLAGLTALRYALVASSAIATAVSAQTSQPGTVELAHAPPDLKTSVDPNIVLTFDDSGSMIWTHMGDDAPFVAGGSWGGPWRCAAAIDASIDPAASGLTAEQRARTRTMNGVYYNPRIDYVPPLRGDGTSFPPADATLAAVWADGIAINRPQAPVAPNAPAFHNNPDSANFADDARVSILTGTGSAIADNRWICGTGTPSDRGWWAATSPMDGMTANPGGNPSVYPNGGPYYYRLRAGISVLNADGSINTANLYMAANWEAVAVPVAQYQNFANWYAYYRTRSLMARSSLSRVFGTLGSNLRVAWQNLNTAAYSLPATQIITTLDDDGTGVAANFRSSFFNWIYQVPASGGTPSRAATIRAGEFFSRSGTGLTNPYWQPGIGSAGGRELSCRQNYHMLVTDGFWNNSAGTEAPIVNPGQYTSRDPVVLPDGVAYDPSAAVSQVFAGPVEANGGPTLADVAFHYWSTDLRGDLADNVAPYIPNRSTGITGSTPLAPGQRPVDNAEIYFNPANDPAGWQHVTQFMVSLGMSGRLAASDDVDCADPDSDMCRLRRGQVNSSGAIGWPQPDGTSLGATAQCPGDASYWPSGQGCANNLDDTWHAALNGRGSFFNAANPSALVDHLSTILNSIVARRGTSTSMAVTLPVLAAGTGGFSAGYDSSDWSGFLHKAAIDTATGAATNVLWDAGCLLTGGACAATGTSVGLARDPLSRVILTSDGRTGTGKPFRWNSLSASQQAQLDLAPVKNQPEAGWLSDGNGSVRLDYLRGSREHELATATPRLRQRGSVLGAVINAQPEYVSSPTGGYSDNFPPNSKEEVAARGMRANPYVAAADHSYAKFQSDNRSRPATVYVAANDGMLHAFNAVDGSERWAYVPNMLFRNGKLNRLASPEWPLVSTVDDKPVVQDVCIGGDASSGCRWKTVLVGSMRMGARGIYALDISDPAGVSEAAAAAVPLWEFSNLPPASGAGTDCAPDARWCSSLGYTFDSVNIARLNNGRWVVLLSSGYFPKYTAGCALSDCSTAFSADPAANRTSLLVIDLETGQLVREILTSTAPQAAGGIASFGLSKPVVYDLGSNQVDELAVAGDLAGNLWRFDLSDATPANWRVDRIFSNYGVGGRLAGDQPISVMPVPLTDPQTRQPIYIFGTGKFLGDVDRQSQVAVQAFYGIRDYGTASPNYPINPGQLVALALHQGADGTRSIANSSTVDIPANKHGWTIPLDIAAERGERNVVAATPLYSNNQAILTTLVPVGDDPCQPGRRGAVMIVDAGTGGASGGVPPVSGTAPPGMSAIGRVLTSDAIPSVGSLPVLINPGGGSAVIPGLDEITPPVNYWTRSAWRTLLDLL